MFFFKFARTVRPPSVQVTCRIPTLYWCHWLGKRLYTRNTMLTMGPPKSSPKKTYIASIWQHVYHNMIYNIYPWVTFLTPPPQELEIIVEQQWKAKQNFGNLTNSPVLTDQGILRMMNSMCKYLQNIAGEYWIGGDSGPFLFGHLYFLENIWRKTICTFKAYL